MAADSSLFRVGDNIELWRVLAHLCALVLAIFLFELALHRLERAVGRSRKLGKMRNKAYRELMVLGLVGLVLKLAKESSSGPAASSMLALQIADLMVFILALALLLQATVVFLRLRKHDRHVERAELVAAGDLVEWSARALQAKAERQAMTWGRRWRRRATFDADGTGESLEELTRLRLLRRLFLKRFGLPELFPFAKYLRQAQDNQLTHMVDVELSTWMVLLLIAWALDALARAVEQAERLRGWTESALVVAFVLFAWALTLLHALVCRYFESSVRQLLAAAGHSTDRREMRTRLAEMAREEAASMDSESAADALRAMERAQETQLQLHAHTRHRLLAFDTGFQLLATCWRHASAQLLQRLGERNDESVRPDARVAGEMDGRSSGAQPTIQLRWFSREAWHLLVILLLMLNGFYLALLVQCGVHQLALALHDTSAVLVAAVAAAMFAPLVVNAVVLQPRIFRHYVIVSAVFRIDAPTLGEVVAHFHEVVALRSEFVAVVSGQLERRGQSVDYLRRAFLAHDVHSTGEIELSKLRAVLHGLGLHLSAFRFNRVVKLMFAIKGMRVQYAHILRMLALADSGDLPRLPRQSMLGQCFDVEDADPEGADSDPLVTERCGDGGESASGADALTPATARLNPLSRQQPSRQMLKRGERPFQSTSSRTLHQLFHADSARDLGVEPRRGQTPYVAL